MEVISDVSLNRISVGKFGQVYSPYKLLQPDIFLENSKECAGLHHVLLQSREVLNYRPGSTTHTKKVVI